MIPFRSSLVAVTFAAALCCTPARAQSTLSAGPAVDTVLSWETYGTPRSARVRVYAADDDRRPRTVVVDEQASDLAPVTDDVRFFVETVGRRLGIDPAEATFVFRYTAASFVRGASETGRRLFLRATFRRTASGDLGPPTWRVVTGDALDDLTSRQLR